MSAGRNLTRKQALVLKAIGRLLEQNGYPPSMRELARELDITPGTAHFHVHSLARRGHLTHDGTDHGITLTPAPPSPDAPAGRLPVAGHLEGGRPLAFADHPAETVEVAAALAAAGSFVLRVRGEGLEDDGILDGDEIVVHRQSSVEDGRVAVLTLPDGSAAVKRVFRERGRLRLEAAGLDAAPVRVPRVRVLGLVLALVRPYGGV